MYIFTLVVVELNIISTLLVFTCLGFLCSASISFADAYELPAPVSRRAYVEYRQFHLTLWDISLVGLRHHVLSTRALVG